MISRRGFLRNLVVAAPAVITTPGLLMPVRLPPVGDRVIVTWEEAVVRDQRWKAKTAMFARLYGAGPMKLRQLYPLNADTFELVPGDPFQFDWINDKLL